MATLPRRAAMRAIAMAIVDAPTPPARPNTASSLPASGCNTLSKAARNSTSSPGRSSPCSPTGSTPGPPRCNPCVSITTAAASQSGPCEVGSQSIPSSCTKEDAC